MWTSDGDDWVLRREPLQARFDVARAPRGLFDIRLHNQPLPDVCILQCDNASAGADLDDYLVDHYVREDDLVATYLQSPARVNRKQLYLRSAGFLYSQPIVGVEMVFSMQTQRLDADPQLLIRSELPSEAIYALTEGANAQWNSLPLPEDALDLSPDLYCGAVVFKMIGADIFYAQILDPSEFAGGRIIRTAKSANHYALSLPVFSANLEKGVIRRGRATGLFFRGDRALEEIAKFSQWYRGSPPQLTT